VLAARALTPLRLTARAAAPLVDWQAPHEATLDELSATHERAYLESLQAASVAGKRFGASTVLPAGGWCVLSRLFRAMKAL